jgi:hypothetical protein
LTNSRLAAIPSRPGIGCPSARSRELKRIS